MRTLSLCCLIFISPFSVASEFDDATHLRTLFTTISERNQLDSQRNSGKFSGQEQKNSSTGILRAPVTVKMQGVVIRKKQKPVIFVNDNNTLKSNTVNQELQVNTKKVSKKRYEVPVQVNQQAVKLKPGQQWNESERKVEDNYQIKETKAKTNVSDILQEQLDTIVKPDS